MTVEHAGSVSDSHVEPDGTVVSDAHAYLSGIQIANVLTIGAIEASAHATSKPGAKPTETLDVRIVGASIAGIAVVLDQDGLRIANATVLGKAQLDAVNKALGMLDKGHVSIRLFPGITEKVDERSASASGSALSVRYDATSLVPTSIDTPLGAVGSPLGDVGKDEEVLLGEVRVSALGVARGAPPSVEGETVDSADLGGFDFGPTLDYGTPAPSTGTPLAVAPLDRGIELARNKAQPGVDALRDAYGLVIICAFVGVAILLAVRRRAATL
jgi:hypothetical protein